MMSNTIIMSNKKSRNILQNMATNSESANSIEFGALFGNEMVFEYLL